MIGFKKTTKRIVQDCGSESPETLHDSSDTQCYVFLLTQIVARLSSIYSIHRRLIIRMTGEFKRKLDLANNASIDLVALNNQVGVTML